MLAPLVLAALLLSAADHWTTWLCLRAPIAGWEVRELNPISDTVFRTIGLEAGLLLDSALTLAGVTFLVRTGLLPRSAKLGFLAAVVLATGYAVLNNLEAMSRMGVPFAAS